MPPLPAVIIQILATLAPLFSNQVWGYVQVLLMGAMLSPGARTVAAQNAPADGVGFWLISVGMLDSHHIV
jgi:hypothetical protein